MLLLPMLYIIIFKYVPIYGVPVSYTHLFMFQNAFQAFLITAERPSLGLAATIAAGISNMVLDALFIAVFDWGVAGAAVATGLSPVSYTHLDVYKRQFVKLDGIHSTDSF